ncbi:hypothetical protein PROFUN_12856 [Planoprotostelium fungivorum]|uniref:Uncharacterized protein n=1 Tax=Planoprotostelium fungivorum TaxID=1890364 RepID=A0A2P6N6B3_9EUKA|nr:hypothetical protein PROFUN_12856 [Planoprotostelium fungivorum]
MPGRPTAYDLSKDNGSRTNCVIDKRRIFFYKVDANGCITLDNSKTYTISSIRPTEESIDLIIDDVNRSVPVYKSFLSSVALCWLTPSPGWASEYKIYHRSMQILASINTTPGGIVYSPYYHSAGEKLPAFCMIAHPLTGSDLPRCGRNVLIGSSSSFEPALMGMVRQQPHRCTQDGVRCFYLHA